MADQAFKHCVVCRHRVHESVKDCPKCGRSADGFVCSICETRRPSEGNRFSTRAGNYFCGECADRHYAPPAFVACAACGEQLSTAAIVSQWTGHRLSRCRGRDVVGSKSKRTASTKAWCTRSAVPKPLPSWLQHRPQHRPQQSLQPAVATRGIHETTADVSPHSWWRCCSGRWRSLQSLCLFPRDLPHG